eukprot:200297_1
MMTYHLLYSGVVNLLYYGIKLIVQLFRLFCVFISCCETSKNGDPKPLLFRCMSVICLEFLYFDFWSNWMEMSLLLVVTEGMIIALHRWVSFVQYRSNASIFLIQLNIIYWKVWNEDDSALSFVSAVIYAVCAYHAYTHNPSQWSTRNIAMLLYCYAIIIDVSLVVNNVQ